MVRVGATKLLGHSILTDALNFLEGRLNKGDYNKKTYKMSELPTWAKPLADYNNPQIGITEDYEKRAIEDAIKKIKQNLAVAGVEKAWRDSIESLPRRNVSLNSLPHDLETINSIYYHFDLVMFIIKSGLQYRSGKKWQVKRNFRTYILITAPRNRFINGKMSVDDAAELARLLDVPKTDLEGYKFGFGHNSHDYWKEYIYRAWGLPPSVFGRTDKYDD